MTHLYDPAISDDFCPLFFRQSLFRVLDEDGSGDIAYTEFVEQVVKMSALAEPTPQIFWVMSPCWLLTIRDDGGFFSIFGAGLFGAIKLGRLGLQPSNLNLQSLKA